MMTIIEFIYDRKYPVAIAADGGSMRFPPNVFEQVVSDYAEYKAENLPISTVSNRLLPYLSRLAKLSYSEGLTNDEQDSIRDCVNMIQIEVKR